MTNFDPKTLPSSLECERYTLAAILEGPESAESLLPRVTADHFTTEAHRLILDAARACLEAEGTVDRVLIAQRLQKEHSLEAAGGVSALVDLSEGMPHLCNIDGYIEVLDKKRALRHLMRVGCEIGMRASLGIDDPEDIARELQKGIDVMPRSIGGALQSLGEVVQASGGLDGFFESQCSQGIPVSFGPLAKMLPILGRGRVITVGGPTGGGKSTLARQLAIDSARLGFGVAVFSLEMSAEETFRAMACTLGGVSTRRVQQGEITAEERKRLAHAVGELEALPIWICDEASQTVSSVQATAMAEGKKRRIDLLIVDYLQLLQAIGKASTRTEAVDGISRGLKRMARSLDVPVLSLTQWSNEGAKAAHMGEEPGLHSIRESGAIAQDSDVVIFLVPQKQQPGDISPKRLYRLVVKKNRSGPTGAVEVLFDPKRTLFEGTA